MSFACTTPTTLSTEPSHTTKRECGAAFSAAAISFGGSVRSIQAISVRGVMIARTGLSARRSTRSIMSRSSVSSTPACAPSTSSAFSSSSVTVWRGARCRPNSAQHRRGRPVEQPDDRPADARHPGDRRRDPRRDVLRPAQGEVLRHQFAQHQGQVGGHHHHQGQRQRLGHRRQIRDAGEPVLQMHGDPRTAEHAGQHADQGDADLHGGQEALRVLRPGGAPPRRRRRPCAPAPQAGHGVPRPAPARSSRTGRSARSAAGRRGFRDRGPWRKHTGALARLHVGGLCPRSGAASPGHASPGIHYRVAPNWSRWQPAPPTVMRFATPYPLCTASVGYGERSETSSKCHCLQSCSVSSD